MRYPSGHKQQTREQILDQAARAFRAQGVAEVSIGDLMRGLGLTHGGFYAHFPSKDALVAAACARALAQASDSLFPVDDDTATDARLARAIRRYLSRAHRDTPDTGCPLPALAGEIVHEPAEVRHGFTEAVRLYVERIAEIMTRSGERGAGDPTDLISPVGQGGRERSEQGGLAHRVQNEQVDPAHREGSDEEPPTHLAQQDAANATALDQALVLVAGMAGAVLLARAIDDVDLSDRLLLAARRFYTDTFAPADGRVSAPETAQP